ncbi:MAG: sensor domain-containing diguanylate cyclase [Candidatus Brocadiia bacterium]|nr:sensor domain-containing diguanylate cyclase [Candidatus Brocadiia bacterium]
MRLSEKFYRDLLDTVHEGVFIVAADGLIEYWSRGAETISGYSSAEMRGRHGCEEGNLHLDEAGSPLRDEDCPLTRTLAENLRDSDVVGRWGGEEFLALLPYADEGELISLGERMRRSVEEAEIEFAGSTIRVTVSVGGTRAKGDDTTASLFERVDRIMFRSKEAGRNRVTIA